MTASVLLSEKNCVFVSGENLNHKTVRTTFSSDCDQLRNRSTDHQEIHDVHHFPKL